MLIINPQNDIMEHFIKEYISPFLRKKGFLKKGLTWNKTVGNVVYVINIQKSKFSKEDEIDFTLNIGIGMTPKR